MNKKPSSAERLIYHVVNPPESTTSCFLSLKTQLSDVIGFNNTECEITEGSVWLCTRTGVEAWQDP